MKLAVLRQSSVAQLASQRRVTQMSSIAMASSLVATRVAAPTPRTSAATARSAPPHVGPKSRATAPLVGRLAAKAYTPRASVAAAAGPDIAALQSKFGIPGSVEILAGREGLPSVRLTHACGASAEIALFGGTVLSWKQANGSEVLYCRPDAKFDKSKPISGGIPHCFPQFGPGPDMQQHGFARNLDWDVAATSADPQPDEADPEVQLVLSPSDYTEKMWPGRKFKVLYTVTLHGETLRTDFRVLNEGDAPFSFTSALHTYFEVAGIDKARVTGLKGKTYLDKTVDANNPPSASETRDAVTFSGPVDSVYVDAGDYCELEVGTGAAVAVASEGWSDTIVWSPWTSMEDCYKEFCCVEKGAAVKPIEVEAGGSWRARMDLSVVDL